MTAEQLRQLRRLEGEIERDQERLTRLKERAGWGKAAGGEGPGRQQALAEAADLARRLEEGIRRRAALRLRLIDYIETMPDSLTREIFKMKYFDGKSWKQISMALCLSIEACKKRHGKELRKDAPEPEKGPPRGGPDPAAAGGQAGDRTSLL